MTLTVENNIKPHPFLLQYLHYIITSGYISRLLTQEGVIYRSYLNLVTLCTMLAVRLVQGIRALLLWMFNIDESALRSPSRRSSVMEKFVKVQR